MFSTSNYYTGDEILIVYWILYLSNDIYSRPISTPIPFPALPHKRTGTHTYIYMYMTADFIAEFQYGILILNVQSSIAFDRDVLSIYKECSCALMKIARPIPKCKLSFPHAMVKSF